MNIDINKIGKASKIISMIYTYLIILVIVFGSVGIGMNKGAGFTTTFIVIGFTTFFHFLGKSIYSLYDYYKELKNENITLKKFKRKWTICLISCLLIIIPFVIPIITGEKNTILNFIPYLVITIVFLMPQFIFLQKTYNEQLKYNEHLKLDNTRPNYSNKGELLNTIPIKV